MKKQKPHKVPLSVPSEKLEPMWEADETDRRFVGIVRNIAKQPPKQRTDERHPRKPVKPKRVVVKW